jgi:CheY-like chemotaxis protein
VEIGRELSILHVEDDPADQKLVKASLKNQQVKNDFVAVDSAEQALEYLKDNGSANKLPNLILLDLNMPGMGGKEFLRSLKADAALKHIPVVVLTTSNAERDILDSYQLQAAGYIHKPSTLDEFKQVMGEIGDYWFLLCKLPTKGGGLS